MSALQAVVELANQEETLQSTARHRLEEALKGSAAERARARKLYSQFFELAVGSQDVVQATDRRALPE